MIEVLVAPQSDLVTVDEARADVGAGDDATLAAVIKRASAAAETFIGRPVLAGTYRETVWLPRPVADVWLSRWPVGAVSGITLDGQDVTGTGWRLNGGALVRWSDGRPGLWGAGDLAVTYTAGHATCPEDIKAAVLTLVRDMYFAIGRDAAIKSDTYCDGTSVTMAVNLPSISRAVTDLLMPYRGVVVG
ncbi:head-tail connector protein [Pararhodospirillum oryzae]|uniref:Phage gp6-like head-tail connector protein n=1 Tax=Pararhodospirillum oryzae TaxID=478448 RepID=A0A512HAZ3_9PROT|nr:hypothetical protein [Pararhodospirillum oryzae]GEO82605.1 hypothetical protein ROR02_27360 [Pararhodospirillum oryzae]